MTKFVRFGVWLAFVGCSGDGGPSTLDFCSSGTQWTGGNEESPLMRPGADCIDCHASGEGPEFSLAGTVMGATDDQDDCDGIEDVVVRITDADGAVLELTTNAAGNFYTTEAIVAPYTAEIERDGVVVAMSAEQTDPSCNACHTDQGLQGAPGRIVAP